MLDVSRGSIDELVMSTVAMVCNCDPDAVSPESRVTDLGLDSMNLMTIAANIESAFSLSLSDSQMLQLFGTHTVSDITNVIQSALESRDSS